METLLKPPSRDYRVHGGRTLPQPIAAPDSRDVRKYIFDYFEAHTSAPLLEHIMRKFRLSRAAAFKTLVELESTRHIALVPGTQRILMAWPFSAVATPFKVKLSHDKREYFANCAWDAVAFHVMLKKDQRIESYCHHCAEEIAIHLKDQETVSPQPNGGPLVYLSLPAAAWWDNILLTCSNNMVFFSTREHLEEWKESNMAHGEALTIEQTLRLSIPFYLSKMEADYARPSRDKIVLHFQSLGLTGNFWKI